MTDAIPAGGSPEDPALELIAARFRVLGEVSRLKLIRALEAGERSVNELVAASGLTQANTSRHLQTLTDAGILGRRREGTSVRYRIADPEILELCHLVCGGLRTGLEGRVQVLRSPGAFARRWPRPGRRTAAAR